MEKKCTRSNSQFITDINRYLFNSFGLLFYSIKSLITQKKIADIKTDFVNRITHELKTPLSKLTLATKMFQNDQMIAISSTYKGILSTIDRQNIREIWV